MEQRKLGYMETYCAGAAMVKANSTTIVTMAEVSGEINEEVMVDAIQVIFERHPTLHSVIVEEQKDYILRPAAQFDDVLIKFTDRSKVDIDQFISEELNTPFEKEKSLWRMSIQLDKGRKKQKIHRIVMTCLHAVGDTASTCMFIHDLLEIYERIEDDIDYEEEPLPFLDSVEELANSCKNLEEYEAEKKHIMSFKPDRISYDSSAEIAHRETRALYHDFSKIEVEAIEMKAKEHKVSVNALLSAAALLAYAQLVDRPIKATFYSHVNLRPYCIPVVGNEHFGLFSGLMQLNFELDPTRDSMFAIARRYRDQFEHEIEYQIYKPDRLKGSSQQLVHHLQKKYNNHHDDFSCGICNINLGKYTHKTELKRHKIESIHFVTAQSWADLPFVIGVISTEWGMYMSVSWAHPNMSEKNAKKFYALLTTALAEECEFELFKKAAVKAVG